MKREERKEEVERYAWKTRVGRRERRRIREERGTR